MRRPSPAAGVLAAAGWIAGALLLAPLVLPPIPVYRTVVAGAGAALFAAALLAPAAAYVLAVAVVATAGASALAFSSTEPAAAAPVALAGFFAGAALRRIYAIREEPAGDPLVLVFRAVVVAGAASAASALVASRSWYLLARGVFGPRAVNVLGEDVAAVVNSVASALASLAVAAGFHYATVRLSRDEAGRRVIDRALVLAALVAGGVAAAQTLGFLPMLRADRWAEWNRAQGTFTDPSAAGVAAALLFAPLLARAAAPGVAGRALALAGAVLLVLLVGDAGSRAGLVGTVASLLVFVIWGLTRLAAGAQSGRRKRLAATVGALALVSAAALAAALSWPTKGAARSALLARLEGLFAAQPAPSERPKERLLLYEGAFAIFGEHPVAGAGLGRFRFEFPNVARDVLLRPVKSSDNPPSQYLGALAESGLAGTAVFLLLLLGVVRGLLRGLGLGVTEAGEAFREAGAAAGLVGLLAVFLFGSHLVYPEVAAFFGILVARLPISGDGRTARLLGALTPVVLAGALVVLAGGVLARAVETSDAAEALRYGPTAGVWGWEREPAGRAFHWIGGSTVFAVGSTGPPGPGGPAPPRPVRVSLPVRNARPDGRGVTVDVFWDDVPRGRVSLAAGGWRRLEMPAAIPGVLRLETSPTFRPSARADRRVLAIECGEPEAALTARVAP